MRKLTHLTTVCLSLLLCTLSVVAEQYPAVQNRNGHFAILKYDPVTDQSTELAIHSGLVMKNTFYFDNQRNVVLMIQQQEGMNFLITCSALTGKILKSFQIHGSVFGGVYVPSTSSYGCFNVNTRHNGYGNNQEEISFVSIDVFSGETNYKTFFPSLSLNAAKLPQYTFPNFNINMPPFGQPLTGSGISDFLFVSRTNEIIFAAKDVTGANRLLRLDAGTGRIKSQVAVHHQFLDFSLNADQSDIKAVAFESRNEGFQYYSVDISLTDLQVKNPVNIMYIEPAVSKVFELGGTSISMNAEGDYFVTCATTEGSVQSGESPYKYYMYSLDGESNEVENVRIKSEELDFHGGYSESDYQSWTYLNSLQVYPNPSVGAVSISSKAMGIKSISVYNLAGDLMRSIQVQDMLQKVEIDLSDMAAGIYFVQVETQGAPFCKKLVIQP